jgi:hypothetical protein
MGANNSKQKTLDDTKASGKLQNNSETSVSKASEDTDSSVQTEKIVKKNRRKTKSQQENNQESTTSRSDFFKRFIEKAQKIPFKYLGLGFLIILIVTLGIYVFLFKNKYEPRNVIISNRTSSSVTISWVTDQKTKGVVWYSDSPIKFPFKIFGAKGGFAYDDREYMEAEQFVARLEGENTSERTITDIEEEIRFRGQNKYFVHHVTVRGLEPEKKYFFRVGNGLHFVKKHTNLNDNYSFKTFTEVDNIPVPNPTYGSVVETGLGFRDLETISEGIVYMQLIKKDEQQEEIVSEMLSALLNEDGGWYIDIANARHAESGKLIFEEKSDVNAELVAIEAGDKGGLDWTVLWMDNDAPAPTLEVGDGFEGIIKSMERISNENTLSFSLLDDSFASKVNAGCPGGDQGACEQSCHDGCTSQACHDGCGSACRSMCGNSSGCPCGECGKMDCRGGSTYDRCTENGWQDTSKSCGGDDNTGGDGGGGDVERGERVEGGDCHITYEEDGKTCDKYGVWENNGGSWNCTWGPGSGCVGGVNEDGKCILDGEVYNECPEGVCATPCANGYSCEGGNKNTSCCTGKCVLGSQEGGGDGEDDSGSCGPNQCQSQSGKCYNHGDHGCSDPVCDWCCNGSWQDDKCSGGGGGASYVCCCNGEDTYGKRSCTRCAENFPDNYSDGTCGSGAVVCCCDGKHVADSSECAKCKEDSRTYAPGPCKERDLVCCCAGRTKKGAECEDCKTDMPNYYEAGACDEEMDLCCCDGKELRTTDKCNNCKKSKRDYSSGPCPKSSYDCGEIGKPVCPDGCSEGVPTNGHCCDWGKYWDGANCVPVLKGIDACKPETEGATCSNGRTCNCYETGLSKTDACSCTYFAVYLDEDCVDGKDNDNDGLVDCDDPACNNHKNCDNKEGDVNPNCGKKGYSPCPNGWGHNGCEDWLNLRNGVCCEGTDCDKDGKNSGKGNSGKSEEEKTLNPLFSQVYAQSNDNDEVNYTIGSNGVVLYPEKSGVYEVDIPGKGSTQEVKMEEGVSYAFYVDENGNGQKDKDEEVIELDRAVDITVEEKSRVFKYDLNAGYNFVSFPFLPNNRKSYDFLEELNESVMGDAKIYSVSRYYSGFQISEYREDVAGSGYGPEFPVVPGWGYVIKSSSDTRVSIGGQEVTEPVGVVFPSEGWFLLGVHGANREYTAESLIDNISGKEHFDANNVTEWQSEASKYNGLSKDKDEDGNMQVYGFDFPIEDQLGYFVRITETNGETWTPE